MSNEDGKISITKNLFLLLKLCAKLMTLTKLMRNLFARQRRKLLLEPFKDRGKRKIIVHNVAWRKFFFFFEAKKVAQHLALFTFMFILLNKI